MLCRTPPVIAVLLALGLPAQQKLPPGVQARDWETAAKRIQGFEYDKGALEIRLFANTQQIQDPTAICFDDQNRLYLTETVRWRKGVDDNRQRQFWLLDDISSQTVADRLAMYKKWQEKYPLSYYTEHSERVIRLEDRDADGRADTRILYAGDFDDPLDGPAIGLIAREGKVWLTCIPHLWELQDTDDDGKADQRRSIQDGFGVRVSLSGHDMHGLAWGPDGKLYWSIGDRGYNIKTKEGKHFADPPSGAVFRCEPDGSEVEVFHHTLRNPQEIAFDQFGNLFTVDNNGDLGDKARVVYVMEGGETGWHSGWQNLSTFRRASGIAERDNLVPWMAEKLWQTRHEGQPAYVLPALSGFTIDGRTPVSGPSGMVFHSTDALGTDLKNAFYICDFRGRDTSSGVYSFKVENDGAGFRVVEHKLFLKGIATPDIDISYDGKMYIADWYGAWTCNQKGNVYTLAHREGASRPHVAQTAALFRKGFADLGVEALMGLLRHVDMRVRLRAQFELARRGRAGHQAMQQEALGGDHRLARLHAIWGVGQLGRQRSAAVRKLVPLLQDPDPEVRANTLKVLGEAKFEAARPRIEARLVDPENRVRAHAAQALGKLGDPASLPALRHLLIANADKDVFLRHAAVHAIERIGDRDFVHAQLQAESRALRLATLLVLRRWNDPKIASFLEDDDRLIVEEAVRAIYDRGIDVGDKLSRMLPGLRAEHSALTHKRVIHANFRRGTEAAAARLLRYCKTELPGHERARVEAMHLLTVWDTPPKVDRVLGLVLPHKAARGDIAGLVHAELPVLLPEAKGRMAAKAVDLAGKYEVDLDPEILLGVTCNPDIEVDFRLSCLENLTKGHPRLLKPRLGELFADDQHRVRAAALETALRIAPELGRQQRLAFLRGDEVQDRRAAYASLDGTADAATAALLVSRLNEMASGKGQKASYLELAEAAARSTHREVQAAHGAYKKSQGSDLLAPYQVSLFGGDKQRGEDLFKNHGIAQCVRCHNLDNKPSAGPGLRGVGVKDRAYLLRSLITPNSEIAEGFGTVMVETRDGKSLVGLATGGDASTLLLKIEDKTVKVPRKDIVDQTKPSSGMVPMAGILKPREVRDLIEFLKSLQPRGKRGRK